MRDGGLPAAGVLVVVVCGVDLVFVVDVAFVASVDLGCDKG